jgi:DNA-binding NtrC family response regulator
MRQLYAVLERLARTELSLLICGETGTGKELAARAVHAASARADKPFVVLDCTTIPPNLAASVLFGHEKGAFTGANERRIGVIEAAHTDVLFIDEVGACAHARGKPPSPKAVGSRVTFAEAVSAVRQGAGSKFIG